MDTTNTATAFGERLFARQFQAAQALNVAQDTANANGCPVMILKRDGRLAIIEEPPDEAECDPYSHGWTDYALVAPDGTL